MSLQLHGTVTRRSNGSIEIRPTTGPGPYDSIVISESALGSKELPAMGDDVTVTIEVTDPVVANVRDLTNAERIASTADVAGVAARNSDSAERFVSGASTVAPSKAPDRRRA